MIEHCSTSGVTTLVIMHFDHNEATRRINRLLGFEEAGHLRELTVVNGQPPTCNSARLEFEPRSLATLVF
jgi:L-amino acid N-acyltransferase YncA